MANEHLFEPVMTPYVTHDESGRQVTAERLEMPHRSLLTKALRSHFPQLREEPDTIEDLVQTTYMKAWEHRDQYNHKAKFSTWLYRIAINATIDHMRKEDQRRAIFDELVSEDDLMGGLADLAEDNEGVHGEIGTASWEDTIEDPDGDPLAWLEAEEALAAANEIVNTLSDTLRETFIMREVQDMSYADIAATLGILEGTAKKRVHDARVAIRAEVARRGEYWPAVVSNYLGN